jgi:hypothetical protein
VSSLHSRRELNSIRASWRKLAQASGFRSVIIGGNALSFSTRIFEALLPDRGCIRAITHGSEQERRSCEFCRTQVGRRRDSLSFERPINTEEFILATSAVCLGLRSDPGLLRCYAEHATVVTRATAYVGFLMMLYAVLAIVGRRKLRVSKPHSGRV